MAIQTNDQGRKLRRQVFIGTFSVLAALLILALSWKLRSLLLPMMVGALLAYLFRPLKDRFQVAWIPHELRVILLFCGIGGVFFVVGGNLRKHFPDEKQKLELKVRLKYKLNEKFMQVTAKNNPTEAGFVSHLIEREASPMMDEINEHLALTPEETFLFLRYRAGYKGQKPISDRFYEYFQANQKTLHYTAPDREPSSNEKAGEGGDDGHDSGGDHDNESAHAGLKESITI